MSGSQKNVQKLIIQMECFVQKMFQVASEQGNFNYHFEMSQQQREVRMSEASQMSPTCVCLYENERKPILCLMSKLFNKTGRQARARLASSDIALTLMKHQTENTSKYDMINSRIPSHNKRL